MTLVWGVRREGPEDKLNRARWLFEYLDEVEAHVVVPAIVLSEYLCHVNQNDHAATVVAIQSRFIVPEFDVRAASVAATLFLRGQSGRVKGEPDSRKCLRADSLIIATAVTHHARVFYSHDDRSRNLAATLMEARDLPTTPNSLFDYGALVPPALPGPLPPPENLT